MKGIILAAGKGLRLNGHSGNTPKCLMEIGGQTLLERQIRALRLCGVEEIIVVVGYEAGRVRQSCDAEIRFVENPCYEQTNSLFSLWLTREFLAAGFIVMNADVLFHSQLLADLIASPHEDALLIDYRDPLSARLGDEEMKVRVRGDRVVDISKGIKPVEADGENVGIGKFGLDGARLLVEEMNALIARGCYRDWAPRAFCEFARRRPLYAVSTGGQPWIEIDFPEDYQRAVNDILPRISLSLEDDSSTEPLTMAQQV
jgi:choline kinase